MYTFRNGWMFDWGQLVEMIEQEIVARDSRVLGIKPQRIEPGCLKFNILCQVRDDDLLKVPIELRTATIKETEFRILVEKILWAAEHALQVQGKRMGEHRGHGYRVTG